MDTLKNKNYQKYDYLSRYSSVPYYFDTLNNREVYGIGTPIKKNTNFLSHKVLQNDTLDSLALKYYNNPSFWWIIAAFNNIADALIPLQGTFTVIKIPNISGIEFGSIR